MNSLVGYGVSSNSESDGDSGDDEHKFTRPTDELKEGVQKHRNFLLETGSASSESDDELDPQEQPRPEPPSPSSLVTLPPITSPVPIPSPSSHTPKLPPPPLGASARSSVFANPFKAQADQKLHALQKHVPLTLQSRPSQIAGKRMCVAYRKDGRCRFGIKCKFAHDSDLQSSIIPGEYDPPSVDDAEPDPNTAGQLHLHYQGGDKETEQGRKRRVGLSNTLVPPKRAMKNYAMQKERERLNLS